MAKDTGVYLFLQHVVGLRMEIEAPRGLIGKTFITFFFLHDGVSFLVTAGHVLESIHEARENYEELKISFYLVDTSSRLGTHKHKIPFSDEFIRISQISSRTDIADFGFIPITPLFGQLLNQNEIYPLTEEWLCDGTEDLEAYFIAGIPSEINDPDKRGEPGKTGFCVKHIHKISRPAVLERDYPEGTFFGEIVTDEQLTDIDGLSGGPIFGLRNPKDGKSGEYRLMGIQAGWIKRKIIIGCDANLMFEHLKKFTAKIET